MFSLNKAPGAAPKPFSPGRRSIPSSEGVAPATQSDGTSALCSSRYHRSEQPAQAQPPGETRTRHHCQKSGEMLLHPPANTGLTGLHRHGEVPAPSQPFDGGRLRDLPKVTLSLAGGIRNPGNTTSSRAARTRNHAVLRCGEKHSEHPAARAPLLKTAGGSLSPAALSTT